MANSDVDQATTEVQTERIAQHGDVILCIGKPASTKLLVSADVMKEASQVFFALLGPHFREGQATRTAENPVEIPFPEDEGSAMRDMCTLLHGKAVADFEKPRAPPSDERILSFAIVVDKYRCAARLHLQSKAVLLHWCLVYTELPVVHITRIAAAAYLLNQPLAFAHATQRMVWYAEVHFSHVFRDPSGSLLPGNVILAMEQRRNAAYTKIATELPTAGIPDCEICGTSEYGMQFTNYDARYMGILCKAFDVSMWPPDFLEMECSVCEAVERINGIGKATRGEPSCEHTHRKKEVTAVELKEFGMDVLRACSSICLTCAKEGKADLFAKCTREGH